MPASLPPVVPLCLLPLLLAACGGDPAPAPAPASGPFVEVSRPLGDGEARVRLAGARSLAAVEDAQAALDEAARLAALLAPDGEALRALRAGDRAPVAVAPELYDALGLALRLADRSAGAYDPTGTAGGWREVELHPPSRSVRLRRPGLPLDLGAFADGYAAQAAWALLGLRGHTACLVEVGGVVVAGEPPPGVRGWPVALPDGRTLRLGRRAVFRGTDAAGVAAVVIAPDGPRAGAFGQALAGMPSAEAFEIATGTDDLEAWLRPAGGEGRATPGFAAWLESP